MSQAAAASSGKPCCRMKRVTTGDDISLDPPRYLDLRSEPGRAQSGGAVSQASRWARAGEKAGTQMATYSAPWGVL